MCCVREQVAIAWSQIAQRLLAEQAPNGGWDGYLSSSAVATATAVSALTMARQIGFAVAGDIAAACAWLENTQNRDGGWGDTPDSPSNLTATLLAAACLRLAGKGNTAAEHFLAGFGVSDSNSLFKAVIERYGDDRTFAAPILVNCCLAGMAKWEAVPRLPFALACLPRFLWRMIALQVVSYALPALISIGIAVLRRAPAGGVGNWISSVAIAPCLRRLGCFQAANGGFLTAVPLTAFVCMSLMAAGERLPAILAPALRFLGATQRPDGSWPIAVNLSLWLTSHALLALAPCRAAHGIHAPPAFAATAALARLLRAQHRQTHPYTGAPGGGWPWTDSGGGVPDVDDTAAALLAFAAWQEEVIALSRHSAEFSEWQEQVQEGVRWLLAQQNRDGGWPTFCPGWQRLSFDRSSPDLSAHALRALAAWHPHNPKSPLPARYAKPMTRAIAKGLSYLAKAQQADGSWLPLWFGNQHGANAANPVIGTSQVLRAYAELGLREDSRVLQGVVFLCGQQQADGGWSATGAAPPTAEETALAVIALAPWRNQEPAQRAWQCGLAWLCRESLSSSLLPAPLGLYFAHLWYAERLYPLIWTAAALRTAIDA